MRTTVNQNKAKPAAKEQGPTREDLNQGKGSPAELVAFHAREMLGRDPDQVPHSLQKLVEHGLIAEPRAVAACVASGFGLQNLAFSNFTLGAVAFYGAFVSSAPHSPLRQATAELVEFISCVAAGRDAEGKAFSFSAKDLALLRHLVSELKVVRPLTQVIPKQNFAAAEKALAQIPPGEPGTDRSAIEAFEAQRSKIDMLVSTAQSSTKLPADFFAETLPSVNKYLLGAVATNFAPSRNLLQRGLEFIRRFDPEMANWLQHDGGHRDWAER
jgi:hypothetical protein